MVHLIKYTYQALWSQIKATTKCHKKTQDFQLYTLKSSQECKSDKIWVDFEKVQGISYPLNTKMSLFCPKMTEKYEFKDTYSPQKEKKAKI